MQRISEAFYVDVFEEEYARRKREAVSAELDPTLLRDDRVLERMLDREASTMASRIDFVQVQREVTMPMRTIVVQWMLEVNDEDIWKPSMKARSVCVCVYVKL